MSNDVYVRLRPIKKGPVTYRVHGFPFTVGMWAVISEVIQLEKGKTFRLADYLRKLEHSDGRPLFDVTDKEGAQKLEQGEIERAERAAAAAKLASVTTSQVSRASRLTDDVAVDDGAETVSDEEREEADDGKGDATDKGETGDASKPAGEGDATGRRAARAARAASKKNAEAEAK